MGDGTCLKSLTAHELCSLVFKSLKNNIWSSTRLHFLHTNNILCSCLFRVANKVGGSVILWQNVTWWQIKTCWAHKLKFFPSYSLSLYKKRESVPKCSVSWMHLASLAWASLRCQPPSWTGSQKEREAAGFSWGPSASHFWIPYRSFGPWGDLKKLLTQQNTQQGFRCEANGGKDATWNTGGKETLFMWGAGLHLFLFVFSASVYVWHTAHTETEIFDLFWKPYYNPRFRFQTFCIDTLTSFKMQTFRSQIK